MRYIVFDLEATCWRGILRPNRQEIIEIGAYKLDEFGSEISHFNSFVKPVFHPHLSSFCKRLTSISQSDVNRAQIFPKVLRFFLAWILEDDDEFILCAWGSDDHRLLSQDCELHNEDQIFLNKYIDVKYRYNEIKGSMSQMVGLQKAIKQEGFVFEGVKHRAISDAYNLAKIFVRYMDEWQL